MIEVVFGLVSAVEMMEIERQEKESRDNCKNVRTKPAYEGFNLPEKVSCKVAIARDALRED